MANTASDFERTAAHAEQLAQSNLASYKLRLALFGVLGYGVIFLTLLILFALTIGLVFAMFQSTALLILLLKKKLILVLIPLMWVLLSSLWVKLEPPQGERLNTEDYPELFAVIGDLSRKLDAPKIHEVILTSELNASIVQTPRLGVFGWNRNTLILGLELLLVLSPDQARAVIAHELGHLSGNHSRFNGWIYRVRQAWANLMSAFDHKEGWGAGLMRRFFDWYAPKFAAYSFALARANEYEADAISAELTNRQTAADALVNVHVAAPYVDENYWRQFFARADEQEQPMHLPWVGLSDFLRSDQDARSSIERGLRTELERRTDFADTHPALVDRLSALKVEPIVPKATQQSAARAWFGSCYAQVLSEFDEQWAEQNLGRWRERYEYVCKARDKLAELAKSSTEELADESLWERARLTEELHGATDAEPIFRAYQERHPENAAAAFVLGRMSYQRDDDELLRQMKLAMDEPELLIDACEYAYHYLSERDRHEEAGWWLDRSQQHAKVQQAAYEEATKLNPKDQLAPIDLSDEQRQRLLEQLKSTGKVKHAWVAQKPLDRDDLVAMVIAIAPKGFAVSEESQIKAAADAVDFDGVLFIVSKSGETRKLAKKAIKCGSKLF